MSIEQYSGIGANTPMTGFGGTSGLVHRTIVPIQEEAVGS